MLFTKTTVHILGEQDGGIEQRPPLFCLMLFTKTPVHILGKQDGGTEQPGPGALLCSV
jgi:hypothetical protein